MGTFRHHPLVRAIIILAVTTFVSNDNNIFLANALNNGLGMLPQMGYNTWYDLQCHIDESILKDTIDKFIELKLNELGYNYFNLDDCWATNRTKEGVLVADPKSFTGGSLKTLADYAHLHGLKFGTYTDRGKLTCAGRPAAHAEAHPGKGVPSSTGFL